MAATCAPRASRSAPDARSATCARTGTRRSPESAPPGTHGTARRRCYAGAMSTVVERASRMATRFRGFLPVVVDVETGGFDAERDALLEIAAVIVRMDENGIVHPDAVVSTHVVPFPG